MTAQLLPPIISSPFYGRFDTNPYGIHDSPSLKCRPSSSSDPAVHTYGLQRLRQASPASIFSVASAPAPNNNENITPIRLYEDGSPYYLRPTPSDAGSASLNARGKADPDLNFRPATSTAALPQPSEHLPTDLSRNKCRPGARQEDASLLRNALKSIEKYKTTRTGTTTPSTPNTFSDQEVQLGFPEVLGDNKPNEAIVLSQQQMGSSDLSTPTRSDEATKSRTNYDTTTTLSDQTPIAHCKRLSTNSSGFVHNVKTASFSNGSFSLVSKSFHLGRSGETHALFGSHSRFSTDSDRPPTSHSIDEAALRRSSKRRQILEELATTEGAYIADLKALVYLMSTLLASANSISNRLRQSMQQNVLDLLHLHEKILEQIHRAAFAAAARKWADTISPRRTGSLRHARWRTMEPSMDGRLVRLNRRTGSSMDSQDISRARPRLLGAEAEDIIDMINIFKDATDRFFAYEEYCANHEIIAHELQRHLPNLWSTYEAGIESLARSLVAIDRKDEESRKAVTVGDLLIKPIQRICKYPLLFEDLLKQTPVSDCPSAHIEVDSILQSLRVIVDAVNHATHNQDTRKHIHRRWSLQARLNFNRVNLAPENFRRLGNAILCGVLHVTYQTRSRVDGGYALCLLYQSVFIVAFPVGVAGRFDLTGLIKLCDLKIEGAGDGKGLQAPSALHTWKLCFAVDGNLHEFILSACSALEEHHWKRGLSGELCNEQGPSTPYVVAQSSMSLDLKSVGVVYGHHGSLARRLSIQRAATVGNRASIYQVIVRNTHNPEELHEFRQPSVSAVSRSKSHMTTNRIVILAPKRSERSRLESALSDVWTKDLLPYPGMIASRGGQIIRASAGSLVRKLSLASIHAPFSRRSASLTVSSRKSYETFSERNRSRDRVVPTFEIRKDSLEDKPTPKPQRKTSHDVPELDSMDRVVNRMIGDSKPVNSSSTDGVTMAGTLHRHPAPITALPVGPDDPGEGFYPEEVEKMQKHMTVEDALTGGKKKRWSNPFGMFKGLSAEGLRHILYSSK